MNNIIKYIWSVCLTFILLIIAKIISDLIVGEKIQFVFLDFLSFFVGAVIISIFLKRDLIFKKK